MPVIREITAGLEKKYWFYTFLAPLTMVGEVVMETAVPYLMALLIDSGISAGDFPYAVKIGCVMLLCSLVSLACGAGGARFSAVAAFGFSRNLRRNLFSKIMRFSFANTDKFSSSSLVTRLTTDVTNVQNVYQLLIRICFRAPLMLVSGTVMAFFINSRLALVFTAAIPVLAAAIAVISSAAYGRFAQMLSRYDRMNSIVQENLIAIRVVKAFVRGGFECGKFDRAAAGVRDTQKRAEKLVIFLTPIMQAVIYASMIAVFWFGGRMVVSGSMKAGELVSFLTYVTQILASLMMIGMVFVSVVLSRASVGRIREVLEEEPDIKDRPDALREIRGGGVDFENVSFGYGAGAGQNGAIGESGGRETQNAAAGESGKDAQGGRAQSGGRFHDSAPPLVLKNISLHIESGQFAGIIGGTGSSKTTLVSLIPRLYDAVSGTVRVGGADVRDYGLVPLRDSVATVLQKNVLFSGTIRDNLRWGDKSAADDEISAACRAADAESFILSFPDGYDTELGQGGVNLSGGQKQRLCIARALLKKPKILILDDSTSAVDTATEKRIRDALKSGFPDITKIVIAQRISSVQDADVIFVLEDGALCGAGTHGELLKTNTVYREVYESQQTGGDADLGGGAD